MTASLSARTKLLYGLGQGAEGIKNFSFEMFLFFYYSRVLGLSGSLAGLSLAIALVFDAITDPLTGSLSDNLRHRWGRRHPFMYAAALPLGLSFGMLFTPPAGLGQLGLFAWLTTGAILVRTAMTLYHVPHLSLGAELSKDYEERTRIVGYRVIFSALGMVLVAAGARRVFFYERTGFENGQLDAGAYPAFGWAFGAAMCLIVLASARGTHSRIPFLPPPPEHPEPASLGRMLRELRRGLQNHSFRYFLIGVFAFFVARGVQLTLQLDLLTYYWDLKDRALTVPLAMVLGFFVGVPVWARAARRLDKKPTLLIGIASFSILVLSAPLLSLAGLWPDPASPWYARGVIGTSALAAFGGSAGLVAAGSMVADIADEHEFESGRRQEGIFFGALSFSVKSSSGLGHLIAGLSLDAVHFPRQVRVEEVPRDLRDTLAWLFCGFMVVLATVSLYTTRRYGLTRQRHADIVRALDERRAGARA